MNILRILNPVVVDRATTTEVYLGQTVDLVTGSGHILQLARQTVRYVRQLLRENHFSLLATYLLLDTLILYMFL